MPSNPVPIWRVGGHWGRTLVATGEGEADTDGRRTGDALWGVLDTANLAEQVAEALNVCRVPRPASATPAWSAGRALMVLSAGAGPDLYCGMFDTTELARQVAESCNTTGVLHPEAGSVFWVAG